MNKANLETLSSVIKETTRVLVFKNRQMLFDDSYNNLPTTIVKQVVHTLEFDYRNDCLLVSLADSFVYDNRLEKELVSILVNNAYNDVKDVKTRQYFENCLQHRLEVDFTFARGVEIILSHNLIEHEHRLDDIDEFLHGIAIATPGTTIVISKNFDGVYGYTINTEGAVNN